MAWHVHPPGISSVHLTHVYGDGPKSGHVLQSNSQAVQGKNSHNHGTTFKPIYLGPLSRANKLIAKERMLPVPRVPLLCEKGRRLPREFRGGEWTGVRSVGRSVGQCPFKLQTPPTTLVRRRVPCHRLRLRVKSRTRDIRGHHARAAGGVLTSSLD